MEQFKVRDRREKGYFTVDTCLVKNGWAKVLGVYGVAVYAVLAAYADNETQDAYPSYQTIASLLNCSRRQVINTIAKLEEFRLIQKSKRFRTVGKATVATSNFITLLHRDVWIKPSEPDAPGNDVHQGGEPDALPVVNGVHQDSELNSPELSLCELTPMELSLRENNISANAEKEAPSLFPDTELSIILFEKIGEEYQAKGRKPPVQFPTLACKRKFDKAASRLNGDTVHAIDWALELGITSIPKIVNNVAKWEQREEIDNGVGKVWFTDDEGKLIQR